MMSMDDMNTGFQPDLSLDQWSAAISKELKGAPLHSLNLKDDWGLEQPPYHKDSNAMDLPAIGMWYPLQSYSANLPEANQLVLDSLMGGSGAVGIDFSGLSEHADWSCLQGVFVDMVSLHFTSTSWNRWCAWKVELEGRGIDLNNTKGTFDLSPFELSSDQLKAVMAEKRTSAHGWRFFSVSAFAPETPSAHVTHELAYLLRQAHEQLITLMESGATPEEAAAMIAFRVEIGESYFIEMAKLRALRFLWAQIIGAYTPGHTPLIEPCILARTSPYFQTRQDPYNNLLRATTQSMSAILGGAMYVEALPYDYYTGSPSAHGYRMARNILQLLIEEGRIHEMVSAADGAYYIESLTEQLAEKAWKHFQAWDSCSLEESYTHYREVSYAWRKSEEERIAAGKKVVVGVNRYADPLVDLIDAKTPVRVR